MVIKITEKCSMYCKHCLNSATADGKHMDFEIFKKAIEFQRKYGPEQLMITGGEPSENPKFKRYIEYADDNLKNTQIIVSTNGIWIESDPEYIWRTFMERGIKIIFQVSYDERYYPRSINTKLPVLGLPNVTYNKVVSMYPQGRAFDNKLPAKPKGTKCFNVRAVLRQLEPEERNLKNLFQVMCDNTLICTPHIDIYGNIKLGESDLCPVCSSINYSQDRIVEDILKFRCKGCKHVLDTMDKGHLRLIGEA